MPYRTRAQIRLEIIGEMKSLCGYPKCYLCDEVGSDVHEIISRNRTQYNEEVREQSFEPELCAWLCDTCHSRKAITKFHQTLMLAQNVGLYGWNRVKTAFDAIPERFRLGIEFPEYEQEYYIDDSQ
jgi:hypothetical protein